jgi:hypothetical protein
MPHPATQNGTVKTKGDTQLRMRVRLEVLGVIPGIPVRFGRGAGRLRR